VDFNVPSGEENFLRPPLLWVGGLPSGSGRSSRFPAERVYRAFDILRASAEPLVTCFPWPRRFGGGAASRTVVEGDGWLHGAGVPEQLAGHAAKLLNRSSIINPPIEGPAYRALPAQFPAQSIAEHPLFKSCPAPRPGEKQTGPDCQPASCATFLRSSAELRHCALVNFAWLTRNAGTDPRCGGRPVIAEPSLVTLRGAPWRHEASRRV